MEQIRVAVADDDPQMRTLIRRVLERDGMTVIGEAADGLAAVELSLELHPDVIVLDIRMPELAGDTAAQVLRTLQPGMGVILVSTEPSLGDPQLRDSVDAVLAKTEIASLGAVVADVAARDDHAYGIRIA